MHIFKKICYGLLAVTLVISIGFSLVTSAEQNLSGGYSTLSTVTDKSSAWILENFGHCNTVAELLEALDQFGCENFIYDLSAIPVIQAFDLDKFIFQDDFHGVCFDFSCFVKCVVLVWKEAHGRQDVQAFVYDVFLPNRKGHSYNFILEDGRTWYLCLTTNNDRVKKGKESLGAIEITGQTPEEYAESYNETVFFIH